MPKIVFSVTVLSLLLFQSVLCFPSAENRRKHNNNDIDNNEDNSYDHFVFAQTWPQTNCWDLNRKWAEAETATCSPCPAFKNLNNWGIHGLWPSRSQGKKHIAFCDKNIEYNSDLISSDLRAELSEKWISSKLKFGKDAFWGYEYKKHGTCALDMQATNSVPKYFKKALELISRYNIAQLIAPEGIVPGDTYEFNQIYRAVIKGFGAAPHIDCSHNPITHEQYISQICICFDKSFQPKDCPSGPTNNCKRKAEIIYPKNLRSC